MTAFVAHNDLQSSPDCEPKSWDERIPKANAVYVLASSTDDDVAARLVARQEAIEYRDFDVRCRSDLRRRANAPAARLQAKRQKGSAPTVGQDAGTRTSRASDMESRRLATFSAHEPLRSCVSFVIGGSTACSALSHGDSMAPP